MKKINYSIDNQCIAEVTVNRNSIRKFNNDYYLKSGQEFEILLRNNTKDIVLATISMNGKRISSSGIVLNPGQKVHLERYLDQNRKFIFETYKVDNSTESLRAIENNGNIEIQFYKEKQVNNGYAYPLPLYNPTQVYGSFYCNSGNSTSIGYNSLMSNINCTTTSSSNIYDYNQNVSKSFKSKRSKVSTDEVETGRVGQGSISNQSFKNYTGQFESYPFKTVSLKLLPLSLKPLEARDLVQYCRVCKTKNKRGKFVYCPQCSTKF